jgi:hypothetical protein
LDALVIEFGGPRGYGIECIERRLVASELRQKDRRPFDCLHSFYYLFGGAAHSMVAFAAETSFQCVGKLLVLTDMVSAVRSFHGNCESQPVKQSR